MSESVQQAQGFYSTFSVWHQYFSQTYSQGQSWWNPTDKRNIRIAQTHARTTQTEGVMINRSTQGLTLVTPSLRLQSHALGMQPHNLALQPSSLSTHSPVFQQHLFCHSGHSSLFWSCIFLSQVPSQPPVVCACEWIYGYEYMCAAEIRGEEKKKTKHVYSFPLGLFKKGFRLQSNFHLILLQWPPAYIILHSCSAHMAQRELSLFYYRSGNLGPLSLALVIACPWVFFFYFFLWQVTPFIQTCHKGPIVTQIGGKGEC